ncbi:MAG: hypothetical protein J0H27_15490 [Xanthomonadales bacterium]|nr:hypothetical protein [Xanthomonadales bacterium]
MDKIVKGKRMMIGKWLAGVGLGLLLGTLGTPAIAQEAPAGVQNPSTAAGLVQACESMLNDLAETEIYQTGIDLGSQAFGGGFCMGYLNAYRALAASVHSSGMIKLACIPTNVQVDDMAKWLIRVIGVHPEWGTLNADHFAFAALEAKWPCTQERTP